MTTNVALPASVSDATTRALVKVLNDRFNSIPIEKVLVWHLDTTVDEAVPHIAELVGVDGPEFDLTSGPPRLTVKQGVALNRIRGTIGAVRRVLRTLDFGEVVFFVDGRRKYDGTFQHDGVFRYGDPEWFKWAVFGVVVTADEAMSVDRARQLWDAIENWKGQRDRFFVVIQGPGDALVVYRARTEIV